jgi:hypothetical protein
MGFLDKFKKKGQEKTSTGTSSNTEASTSYSPSNNTTPTSAGQKRIKKYTSDGKPIYE